jgi:hypothetical protein
MDNLYSLAIVNSMSTGSDKVKKWRRKTKDRIIKAFGGGCCVCGYNNCVSALALHHLDPSQKDLGLGEIRANPKSWDTIVKELRKCVLVCHNHHCEIHEGIITVPVDAPKFDESVADYRTLEAEEGMRSDFDNCPVCNKLKRSSVITCSLNCAAKNRFKIDWSAVDLKEEIKDNSITSIAERLGCSDATVHKRLKKLGLK